MMEDDTEDDCADEAVVGGTRYVGTGSWFGRSGSCASKLRTFITRFIEGLKLGSG